MGFCGMGRRTSWRQCHVDLADGGGPGGLDEAEHLCCCMGQSLPVHEISCALECVLHSSHLGHAPLLHLGPAYCLFPWEERGEEGRGGERRGEESPCMRASITPAMQADDIERAPQPGLLSTACSRIYVPLRSRLSA